MPTTNSASNHTLRNCQSLMKTLTRKPSAYDQVALYTCDDLITDARKALLELDIHDASNIISQGNAPYGDFTRPDMPVWFIMRGRSKVYLVNTEGANYCQYMVRLVDMPEKLKGRVADSGSSKQSFRDRLQSMFGDQVNDLRDAYYTTSDGLIGLLEVLEGCELLAKEYEVAKKMKEVFVGLDEIGKTL